MPNRFVVSTVDSLMHLDSPGMGRRTDTRPLPSTPSGALEEMQHRLDRQYLLIQTLLMILIEKKVIHEDEFVEWMDYVDELDGSKDGRLKETKTPQQCPKCKRRSPATATKCIYCAEDFPTQFLVQRPE